jgi:hypothetical protein
MSENGLGKIDFRPFSKCDKGKRENGRPFSKCDKGKRENGRPFSKCDKGKRENGRPFSNYHPAAGAKVVIRYFSKRKIFQSALHIANGSLIQELYESSQAFFQS